MLALSKKRTNFLFHCCLLHHRHRSRSIIIIINRSHFSRKSSISKSLLSRPLDVLLARVFLAARKPRTFVYPSLLVFRPYISHFFFYSVNPTRLLTRFVRRAILVVLLSAGLLFYSAAPGYKSLMLDFWLTPEVIQLQFRIFQVFLQSSIAVLFLKRHEIFI